MSASFGDEQHRVHQRFLSRNGLGWAVVAGTLIGCASATPEGPSAETPSDAAREVQGSFGEELCDGQSCRVADIRDPKLNYGLWLATALGIAELRSAQVVDADYVRVGPASEGQYFDLGRVRYVARDNRQAQDIATSLNAVPGHAFSDGEVAMHFIAVIADRRLDVWFSDSFHPAVDRLFDDLKRAERE